MSESKPSTVDKDVVQGEFIDAEVNQKNTADQSDRKTSAPSKKIAWPQPIWLWLAVMAVSGVALAFAVAAWLMAQQPSSTGQQDWEVVYEQQVFNQSLIESQLESQAAQLKAVKQKLAQYDDKLEQHHVEFAREVQALHQLSHQLQDELGDLKTQIGDLSSLSAREPSEVIPLDDRDFQQALEQMEADVQQGLTQLNQRLQQLAEQQEHWVDEFGPELETFKNNLQTLAERQADWMERLRPQLEEAATEIKPQLEGIWSHFNQLFNIIKHDSAADEAQQELPEQQEPQR